MMKALFAAALLAGSTALYAQSTPPADAGKGPRPERRFDCSKAKDPKACEERRDKARAAVKKAREACDARQGTERRECMRQQMCAQSADPAKCEARAKERTAQREKIREACRDKKGDELRSCIREQRKK